MKSTNSQSTNEINIKDVISHLETQVHLLSMYDELLQPSLDILDMQLIKNELDNISSKLDTKLSYFNMNYSVEDLI